MTPGDMGPGMAVQQHDRRAGAAVAYAQRRRADIDVVQGEAVEHDHCVTRPARGESRWVRYLIQAVTRMAATASPRTAWISSPGPRCDHRVGIRGVSGCNVVRLTTCSSFAARSGSFCTRVRTWM